MNPKVKVGVKVGGGPKPGYEWGVLILDAAHEEACEELDEDQYAHMRQQVRELAREKDPTHSSTCSVDAIEDFHELRDKGGVLRSLNVRLFFWMDKKARALVVLGLIKKQNDGPTPLGDKLRMRRRKRLYVTGALGHPPSVT